MDDALLDRLAVQAIPAAGVFNLFSTKEVITAALANAPYPLDEETDWWLDRVVDGRKALTGPPFLFTSQELKQAEKHAGGRQQFEARCVAVAGAQDLYDGTDFERPFELESPDAEGAFWNNFLSLGMRSWMGVPAIVPSAATQGNSLFNYLDALVEKVKTGTSLRFASLPEPPEPLGEGATDEQSEQAAYAYERIVAALRDHDPKVALVIETDLQRVLWFAFQSLNSEQNRADITRGLLETTVPDPTPAEQRRLDALVEKLGEKLAQEADRRASEAIIERLEPTYEKAVAEINTRLTALADKDFSKAAQTKTTKKKKTTKEEAEFEEEGKEGEEELGAGIAAKRPRRTRTGKQEAQEQTLADFQEQLELPFLAEFNTVELAQGLLEEQLNILQGKPPSLTDIQGADVDKVLKRPDKDAYVKAANAVGKSAPVKEITAMVKRAGLLLSLRSKLNVADELHLAQFNAERKWGKAALEELRTDLGELIGTKNYTENKNNEGFKRPIKRTLEELKLKPGRLSDLKPESASVDFTGAVGEILGKVDFELGVIRKDLAEQIKALRPLAQELDQRSTDVLSALRGGGEPKASAPAAKSVEFSGGKKAPRKPDTKTIDELGGEGNRLLDPLLVTNVRDTGSRMIMLVDKLKNLFVELPNFDDEDKSTSESARAVCLVIDTAARKIRGRQPSYVDQKYERALRKQLIEGAEASFPRASASASESESGSEEEGGESDPEFLSTVSEEEEDEELAREKYAQRLKESVERGDVKQRYDNKDARKQIVEDIKDFYDERGIAPPVGLDAQKGTIEELVAEYLKAYDAYQKFLQEQREDSDEERETRALEEARDSYDEFYTEFKGTVLYKLVSIAGFALQAADADDATKQDKRRSRTLERFVGGSTVDAREFELSRDRRFEGQAFRKGANPFKAPADTATLDFVYSLADAVVEADVALALKGFTDKQDVISSTAGAWTALYNVFDEADKPDAPQDVVARADRMDSITNQWGRVTGGVLRFAVFQTPEWYLLSGLTIATYSGLLDVDPPLRLPQDDREFVEQWAKQWHKALKKKGGRGPRTQQELAEMPREVEAVLRTTREAVSTSGKKAIDDALLEAEPMQECIEQLADVVRKEALENSAAGLGQLVLEDELKKVAPLIGAALETDDEKTLDEGVEYFFGRGRSLEEEVAGDGDDDDSEGEEEEEDEDAPSGSEGEARLIAHALKLTNGDMHAAAKLLAATHRLPDVKLITATRLP